MCRSNLSFGPRPRWPCMQPRGPEPAIFVSSGELHHFREDEPDKAGDKQWPAKAVRSPVPCCSQDVDKMEHAAQKIANSSPPLVTSALNVGAPLTLNIIAG